MTKKFKKIFVGIIASAMCAVSSVGALTASATEYLYTGFDSTCGCWNEWNYSCTSVPLTNVWSTYINDSHSHWTTITIDGTAYPSSTVSAGSQASVSKNRGLSGGVVVNYNNSNCANSSTTGYLYWS